MMTPVRHTILSLLLLVLLLNPLLADDYAFNVMNKSLTNFITCELTRTNAKNYFKGKSFKITMIDLFDIQQESDLTIVTCAIDCFVENSHQILYAAVGVKEILGKKQVLYLTIRPKDFSILATELIRFPYKERCPWTQYWVDID
jgi:hypothetical protein